MPTLTEDIDLPGGVDPEDVHGTLQLWGSGAAVSGVVTADGTRIAGLRRFSGATWSIPDVVGNTAITDPAGSVYRVERTWPGLADPLVTFISMPATGSTYRVDELEVDPPNDLPTLVPSNELDRAEISSNATIVTIDGFRLYPVPGLVVTVPDRPFPSEVRAKLWMHASVANANLGTFIAVPGLVFPNNTIGLQVDGSMGFVGAIGKQTSPFAWATFDPHSPGDWQAYVYADAACTVTVVANNSSKARIQAVGL